MQIQYYISVLVNAEYLTNDTIFFEIFFRWYTLIVLRKIQEFRVTDARVYKIIKNHRATGQRVAVHACRVSRRSLVFYLIACCRVVWVCANIG